MNFSQMSVSESFFLFNPGLQRPEPPQRGQTVGTRLLAMGVAASQMSAGVRAALEGFAHKAG